jgi:hypothetical protein
MLISSSLVSWDPGLATKRLLLFVVSNYFFIAYAPRIPPKLRRGLGDGKTASADASGAVKRHAQQPTPTDVIRKGS